MPPPEEKAADRAADEAEIRTVQMRQAEAWNRHDAKAYAALFAEDADDRERARLRWWRGRAGAQSKLGAAFAFVFAESTLSIAEVHTRFLAPDVAADPRALDDGRGEDSSGRSREPQRWNQALDPRPNERAGKVDRALPEHERGAGDARPRRSPASLARRAPLTRGQSRSRIARTAASRSAKLGSSASGSTARSASGAGPAGGHRHRAHPERTAAEHVVDRIPDDDDLLAGEGHARLLAGPRHRDLGQAVAVLVVGAEGPEREAVVQVQGSELEAGVRLDVPGEERQGHAGIGRRARPRAPPLPASAARARAASTRAGARGSGRAGRPCAHRSRRRRGRPLASARGRSADPSCPSSRSARRRPWCRRLPGAPSRRRARKRRQDSRVPSMSKRTRRLTGPPRAAGAGPRAAAARRRPGRRPGSRSWG